MRFLALLATSLSVTHAFSPQIREANAVQASRQDFIAQTVALTSAALLLPEAAVARGRATLEKSFERYGPRIRAGGAFYKSDLRKLVEKNDWKGIKTALQDPPSRQPGDLQKPDAGVAQRAREAGGFSDARVLVAADLMAAAFSDNSISPKTRKMQASVASLREVVEEMQALSRQALGEEKGGFLGFGAKKTPEAELAKRLRELYIQGGNAWNEYVFALNEDLALQFDRFEYVS